MILETNGNSLIKCFQKLGKETRRSFDLRVAYSLKPNIARLHR